MPYPEGDHVHTVCKASCGPSECRYLAHIGGNAIDGYQFSCEKNSPLRSSIDRSVNLGRQREAGNNCAGLDWR